MTVKRYLISFLTLFFILAKNGISQTCSDGIQNQNETGIDCGGVCGGAPVNDEICNAIILPSDGTVVSGNSTNCSNVGPVGGCISENGVGVYFRIDQTFQIGRKVRIRISNSTLSGEINMLLLKGSSCSSATPVEYYCGDSSSVFEFTLTEDSSIYWLYVSNNLGETGNFNINIIYGTIIPCGGGWFPQSDCNMASIMCNQTSTSFNDCLYGGYGTVQEVNDSCLPLGETNSTWFIFRSGDSGILGIDIDSKIDVDFALYNITTSGCDSIPWMTPVRCNSYKGMDSTGLSSLVGAPELPAISNSDSSYSKGVVVSKGEQFAIVVNQDHSLADFSITITGISVYDSLKPTIDSVYSVAADSSVAIRFNREIYCASVNVDDYVLLNLDSGKTYPFSIDLFNSTSCTGLLGQTLRSFNLEVANIPKGNYRLCMDSIVNVATPCGNVAEGNQCVEFFYLPTCKTYLTDTLPPLLDSAFSRDVDSNIVVQFNEKFECSSFKESDLTLMSLTDSSYYIIDSSKVDDCNDTIINAGSRLLIFVSSLAPGTYRVSLDSMPVLRDSCGNYSLSGDYVDFEYLPECDTMTITGTVTNNIKCFDDSNSVINIQTTNGSNLVYSLDGVTFYDTPVFSGLPSGTYDLFAQSSIRCPDTSKFPTTIANPSPSLLNIDVNVGIVSCFGGDDGTAEVLISGGIPNYHIDWFSYDSTALSTGFKTIEITDSLGCKVMKNFFVGSNSEILAKIEVNDVLCHSGTDGAATVNISGGISPYSIDWGTNDSSSLSYGNYQILITDSIGCAITDSFFVNQPDSIASYSIGFPDNGDSSGAVQSYTSGGAPPYQYSIDSTNFQFSSYFHNLSEGNYVVYILDDNGCLKLNFVDVAGVNGLSEEWLENILLYPNPSTGAFVISGIPSEIEKVLILNPEGQTVLKLNSMSEIKLNLEAGVYYVQFFKGANSVTKKLIIK